MAYSLEQARDALKRSLLWREEDAVLEPLIGINDERNRVFRTQSRPITGLSLYQSGGSAPYDGDYTAYDTGVIVFDSPPLGGSVPLASYAAVEYTDAQLLDVTHDGFSEMERRYRRGYFLVVSGGSTYISSGSATVIDPVVRGTVHFSESYVQTGLLNLCCLMWLVRARRLHAASNSIMYRESITGGVNVDKRSVAAALAEIERDIDNTITEAIEDAESETEGTVGYYIPGARSDDYEENFEWWEGSRQETGVTD